MCRHRLELVPGRLEHLDQDFSRFDLREYQ